MAQISKLTIFQSYVFHCVDNMYTKWRDEMDYDPTDLYKKNNQHNSVQKCW